MIKRFQQLLFACIIVGLFTFQSAVKADEHSQPSEDGKTGNKAINDNGPGTGSPVNNNIVFLIVVGVAISGKIITDKIKSVRQ